MSGNAFINGALQGAVGGALTQGIGVATGLQHGFDWKGIAVSAIAQGIGQGVRAEMLGANYSKMDAKLVGGFAGGVASAVARGGSLGRNIGAVTMDAVASTIGNSVVDQIATSSTQKIYGVEDGNRQVGPDFRSAGSSGSGALSYSGGYTPGDQRAAGYPGAARFVVTPTDRDGFDIQGVSTGTNDGYDTYRDLPPPTGVQQTIEITHHQGSMAYGLEDLQQPASNFNWTLNAPSRSAIRELSYGEGIATFNPVGQAIRGAVDHVSAAVVGAWNLKMHPLDTLGGIVRHYSDAYQADRLGDTLLNDTGNLVHGALNSTPVGLVNTLYRKDEAGGFARIGGAGVDSLLWVAGTMGNVGGGAVGRPLQIEEFIAPSTGKSIQAAVNGNAIVPIDKISLYARGRVADVSEELSAFQQYKQSARKMFDANPANIDRLEQLKSMQHNFDRSSDMASQLENIGLANTKANNDFLINHLLDTGQNITPLNRLWAPSQIEGPNGVLQVKSTWKILDDNRAYLNTLMFVPIK
jgi:hypothetical protein